jgi:murein DD-endopeptidase MepM/ murein hydrolase activator NlpD
MPAVEMPRHEVVETAIAAIEAGTVAYAGNELHGYGNLILIKHADEVRPSTSLGSTTALSATSGDLRLSRLYQPVDEVWFH